MSVEDRLREELRRQVADVEPAQDAWASIQRRLESRGRRRAPARLLTACFALAVSAAAVAWLWVAFRPSGGVSRPAAETAPPLRSQPRVSVVIPVGEVPEDITVGEGAVWVSVRAEDYSSAELVRIDPATNQVVARVPVGERIGHLTTGAGAVWGVSVRGPDPGSQRFLVRIDPVTNRVVATVPDVGAPGPEVGGGAVWATASREDPATGEVVGTVVRIDPGTNEVVAAIPLPTGKGISALRFGAGALWVLVEGEAGTEDLLRIDPRTNEVVAHIRAGAVYGQLAVGADALWVSRGGTDAVQIDPLTDEVVGDPIPLGRFYPIATDQGGVWFVTFDEDVDTLRICRLDAGTSAVDVCVGGLSLAWLVPPSAALDPGSGAIWVANDRRSVTRIDLRSAAPTISPTVRQSPDGAG
jgi:hypothetical protein